MTVGATAIRSPKGRPGVQPGGGDARVLVEIAVESPLWSAEPDAETIVRRALRAACAATPDAGGEVSVVLTGDAAIRILNRDWRKLDKPTNVLSFPAPRVGRDDAADQGGAPALLGDIVIAYETTAREAEAEGKPLSGHLAHLVVHGFLHLLGYDHESDAAATDMEGLETRILATLDVPDPHATRDIASGHHA